MRKSITWIGVDDALPNFKTHGFHTGKEFYVRDVHGKGFVAHYEGYGIWGYKGKILPNISHWRHKIENEEYKI